METKSLDIISLTVTSMRNQLLEEFEIFRDSYAATLNSKTFYREDYCELSKKIVKEWSDTIRGNINIDAIEIWCEHNRHTELRYGNLYSYVVMQGVIIPYSEWIYEDECIVNGIAYALERVGDGTYGTGTIFLDTSEQSSVSIGSQ